jgi:hypothetical protein
LNLIDVTPDVFPEDFLGRLLIAGRAGGFGEGL